MKLGSGNKLIQWLRVISILSAIWITAAQPGVLPGAESNVKTSFTFDNLFRPGTIPTGFKLQARVQYYGTIERKLQDGSIFDYMDGGGVVYLKYGFTRMAHAEMKNETGARITLDIFDFSTPINAQSALADEAICSPGFSMMDIQGVQCKAYAFSPEFFLYFTKSNLLVYIYISDDTQADVLKNFVNKIFKGCEI
jgi:hypothetical protein